MEKWKDISGYESKYQVSNYGNIKSLNFRNTGKEKIMTPRVTHDNYLMITLYKNGKFKNYLVHRLVANAFIENPENYQLINHKDENKLNNSVYNLEYCDYKYNNNYGTHRDKLKQARIKYTKRCASLDDNGEIIKIYNKIKDTRIDGYDDGLVVKCCKGKVKHHGNLCWKYLD